MRISKKNYQTLLKTLERSMIDNLELGSFGLYLPSEDRVLDLIEPSETNHLITKQEKASLDFNNDLKQLIKQFNSRNIKKIDIGNTSYHVDDGLIIGYHTHPSEKNEVVPSKYDRTEMLERNSPLEIVLSANANKFLPSPVVIGYHENFFNGYKDFYKNFILSDIQEISKRLAVDIETGIPNQIASLHQKTGLYPSIDVVIYNE